MASNNKYEYLNETSIDELLICHICRSPLVDPISSPCQHTACCQCIKRWLKNTSSCPVCRKSLVENDLKPVTERILLQMLNRLKVKCTECGQTDLERGNFNDHIEKACTNSTVECPSAAIKCPWRGQRDQLNDHLATCVFEPIRPMFSELINENQQLKEQVQQLQMNNQRQQDTGAREMNTTGFFNGNRTLIGIIDDSDPRSEINLYNKELYDIDMEYVVQEAIIRKQCKILDLSANHIRSEGASALANVLATNPILEKLYLDHNCVSDMGAQQLAQAISANNTNLRVLLLGSNCITYEGAQHLAEMLKTNRTLNRLYLFDNNIGDRGIQLLAQALTLHNRTVTHIDLNGNTLESDLTVDFLVDMLKSNQSLKELRVCKCNLSEASKIRLRDTVRSKRDFELRA
ncbi:unnamed protein product [Rotaria socialis]|uniref:RING-type domain-containing protein n=3 Tax=Rotaria socialis TaxID=392032 RepID=A0A820GRX8_9BILA|nr:unnamed protein product [Rotaria socialis]CAF4422502.1 unnamed protein product [Rotaria socialis]CAF4480236.1 unnamed protein product [Rotaria socialis]CAF4677939.1 unnamed protein product [Rotaria socialis]